MESCEREGEGEFRGKESTGIAHVNMGRLRGGKERWWRHSAYSMHSTHSAAQRHAEQQRGKGAAVNLSGARNGRCRYIRQ